MNEVGLSSLFGAAVSFQPGEERNYLFALKPSDSRKKLDTNAEIVIGNVDVVWKNYFGDSGSLKIGPYKT